MNMTTLSAVEKLQFLITEAKNKKKTYITFEDELDDACIDELVAFNELEGLFLRNGTFPINEIVLFTNLKDLVVNKIELPAGGANELTSDVYWKLVFMNRLSILSPMDMTVAIDLFSYKFPCVTYLVITGQITKARIKVLRGLITLHTLVVQSEDSVELGWFGRDALAEELVVKAPIFLAGYAFKQNNYIDKLRLYNCLGIDDFSFLADYRSLNTLTLRKAPALTVNKLKPVFEMSLLNCLDLSGTPALRNELLLEIQEYGLVLTTFVAVRDLSDAHAGFTNSAVANFLENAEIDELSYLNLSGHQLLTPCFFSGHIRCLGQLKRLGLQRTGFGENYSVEGLIAKRQELLDSGHFQKLETLHITIDSANPNLTPKIRSVGTNSNPVKLHINTVEKYSSYGYRTGEANSINELLTDE
jgi:hypothetical protein